MSNLYKKIRGLVLNGLPCILFLSSVAAFAQEEDSQEENMNNKPADVVKAKEYPMNSISGKVVDAATGVPLAGVSIRAYNNNLYTAMTDEDGTYTVDVPTFTTSLSMSADGYNMVQIPLNKRTEEVNAILYSNKFAAEYNPKNSAVKAATASDFDLNNDLSIDNSIQNKLGGDIRTITRSGMPGMGANMFMNGINSLGVNAQPLVVIDGVITDMQYGRSMLHDGYYNNILANLSVSDIEKVTVMKNGTAIYGAQGGNGVILIDTKRNKTMVTTIDVNIGTSYELVPDLPSLMNASEYRSYASELLGSTPTKETDFVFLQSDPTYYYYKKYHNETDWTDQVYKEAFTQNYGINVQGGDEVANYNLSVGYAQGNSTLKKNDFSRFNLRLNSDIILMKNLTARFDASYSDVDRNLRDDGVMSDITNSTVTSPGFLSMIKSPFLNPYAYDKYGNLSGFLESEDDYLQGVLRKNYSLANPSSILHYGEGKNKNNFGNRMINLAITPKYQINKNLSISEHFAYSLINTNENYYLPVTGVPNFEIEGVGMVTNVVEASSARTNFFSTDTRVNWENRYGAHAIALMGGVRYTYNAYKLDSQKGYNSGNDKTPNMGDGLSYKSTSGVDDKCKMLTYYGTADYNFQEKYYLMAGLAVEASSRYGEDVDAGVKMFGVPWGIFPSVEAAWVATSEPWFKTNDIVNYLKLNAGFDIAGNNNVDNTASRTYFTSNTILNSVSGLVLSNIGNTKLRWETTKRFTFGMDMNMLNNRLNIKANYFTSKTDNLLTLKNLEFISGLEKNWSNDGSLKNNGFDISFNAKLINTKDWKWDMGASAGHYKNKLKSLPDNNASIYTDIYGATVISQVGSPVGLFYGYKTDGVYATTEEAKAAGLYQVSSTGSKQYFEAGDVKFVNVDDSDKEINEKDRVVIGDPNPDLYGTIFTNLNYKRFALGVVLSYSLGNDVFNYQRSILESGSYFYNQSTAMLNRWTNEGQNTDMPKLTYNDPHGNARFSDRWIEDGSYLRLKNVTFSYALPVSSTYLQGITVWAAGNNLFTFTKYLGSDPETSLSGNVLSQGIDRGLVARGVSFSLGVKINL